MDRIHYLNKFKGKGHKCDELVIRCMDFRFHEELENHLDQFCDNSKLSYDSRGSEGGSHAIIDETSRASVMEAIELAADKHGVETIIIVDHIDCGAYGGSGEHESEEAEREFHVTKLQEACDIVKEKYPGLKIVLLYQDWDSIERISPKEA